MAIRSSWYCPSSPERSRHASPYWLKTKQNKTKKQKAKNFLKLYFSSVIEKWLTHVIVKSVQPDGLIDWHVLWNNYHNKFSSDPSSPIGTVKRKARSKGKIKLVMIHSVNSFIYHCYVLVAKSCPTLLRSHRL